MPHKKIDVSIVPCQLHNFIFNVILVVSLPSSCWNWQGHVVYQNDIYPMSMLDTRRDCWKLSIYEIIPPFLSLYKRLHANMLLFSNGQNTTNLSWVYLGSLCVCSTLAEGLGRGPLMLTTW